MRDRQERAKVLASEIMKDAEMLQALVDVTKNLTIIVNKLMEFEGNCDSALIAIAVLRCFERRHGNFLVLINWFVCYFRMYV